MENLKKLKELILRFDSDVKLLAKLDTYREIDRMERQLVQELQALQSVIDNAVYRDLYVVVKQARRDLENRPLIVKQEEGNGTSKTKDTEPTRSKRRSTKKTK